MALCTSTKSGLAYPAAIARIERLKQREPGWNAHRSLNVTQASREAAIVFLRKLWAEFGASVPEPSVVAPTAIGGVAVEWVVKDLGEERGIEVVCLPERYEYSIRNRATGRLEDDSQNASLRSILTSVIKLHVADHSGRPS